MATIEERSWDAAIRRMQGDSVYALGYKDGATEQKAIDIEKACEWLKAYDVTFTETPSMLEDFRKSMEE